MRRDGEAIVSMSDETLSEKMLSEETLLTETADGYSFGWSSPGLGTMEWIIGRTEWERS